CEKAKTDVAGEESRARVMKSCAWRAEDIRLSDYPLRALMPIAQSRVSAFFNETRKAELNKTISSLRAKYASTFGGLGLHIRLCPQVPNYPNCRAIEGQIRSAEQELELFLAANTFQDVGQSRYVFWIEN